MLLEIKYDILSVLLKIIINFLSKKSQLHQRLLELGNIDIMETTAESQQDGAKVVKQYT